MKYIKVLDAIGRSHLCSDTQAPRGLTPSCVDALQKKVKCLESENLSLKVEAAQLNLETVNYEEKEEDLVKDCVRQLTETNQCIAAMSDELGTKSEVITRQQDKITQLMTQIIVNEKQLEKVGCDVVTILNLNRSLPGRN